MIMRIERFGGKFLFTYGGGEEERAWARGNVAAVCVGPLEIMA